MAEAALVAAGDCDRGYGGGSVIVARLAAHAMDNVEHLPQTIYLLLKIPWNFTRNVLGIVPWSDANQYFCAVPKWSMALHYKSVHAVGVCGFSFEPQRTAALWMLAEYGVLPVLVVMLFWRRHLRKDDSVLLRFSFIYGGISLVLAPMLGAGIGRLLGYAWPLFLVAGPLLLRDVAGTAGWPGGGFRGTSFFVANTSLCGQMILSPMLLPNPWLDVALWIVAIYAVWLWLGRRVNAEAVAAK